MLSFSVPEGYVVKSMTFTGKAADSSIDPEIGLYGSKVWTGSANPLNLNLLATINVETITVVYDLGVSDAPKTPQEVSFPQETYEITFGDDFTAPALSGAQTAVTYSTSNKDVATVDESGNVTVTGAGTATITAVAEADGTYRSAKASYKLIVNPAASEEVMTLPWNEDFSGDDPLANYTIVNGDSDTKLYNATNAGGEAPEILIGKNGGALTVKVDMGGYSGYLTLSLKSNYPNRVTVESLTDGVNIEKALVEGKSYECVIEVPAATKELELTIKNSSGDNTRVDDISLTKGATQPQTLSFSGTSYTFTIGKDVPANFEEPELTGAYTTVTYSSSNTDVATVDAETGAVTLGSTAGTAEITATAAAENGYKEANASYTITLETPSSSNSIEVVFSTYSAGTQYAENEEHRIDDVLTLYTTQCHFTTELRIYSSSTHDGYVVSNQLPGDIKSITLNAGYNADKLNVYGSTDGNTWSLVGSATTTSNYADHTISFAGHSYKYFKLDVAGGNQIRVKKITVEYITD